MYVNWVMWCAHPWSVTQRARTRRESGPALFLGEYFFFCMIGHVGLRKTIHDGDEYEFIVGRARDNKITLNSRVASFCFFSGKSAMVSSVRSVVGTPRKNCVRINYSACITSVVATRNL